MSDTRETRRKRYWSTAPKLSQKVFAVWRKSDGAISPVAIVATVDPDGTPRAVPFGSLRAVTPRVLRLCILHHHDTFANLRRDERVTVVLVSPPDIAVSVRGRARVVREQMEHNEYFAVLDIDVEEVKNDMGYRIVIESAITISAQDEHKQWYEDAMRELETIETTE